MRIKALLYDECNRCLHYTGVALSEVSVPSVEVGHNVHKHRVDGRTLADMLWTEYVQNFWIKHFVYYYIC